MKRNLISYSSLALLLGACSKDHGDSSNSGNTWTFAGTTYTAGTVVYVDAGSQANLSAGATGATATSADGLVFLFLPPPTSNGQMLITKFRWSEHSKGFSVQTFGEFNYILHQRRNECSGKCHRSVER